MKIVSIYNLPYVILPSGFSETDNIADNEKCSSVIYNDLLCFNVIYISKNILYTIIYVNI